MLQYQTNKLAGDIEGKESTRNLTGIQNRKMHLLRTTIQRSRTEAQKEQDSNETENISLKNCASEGVRNYNEKSSGGFHNIVRMNSLLSGIFNIFS